VDLFFRSLNRDAVLVLDGIPRKPSEIDKMSETLATAGRKIDIAFYFNARRETCLFRIIHRWTCPTCQRTYHAISRPSRYKDVCEHCTYSFLERRKDDTAAGFETRWNVFVLNTGPAIFELSRRGILFTIDAEKSVEEILAEVINTVKSQTGVTLKILDAANQLPE
jgi:adenylate kinase